MDKAQIKTIVLRKPVETENFGARIGRNLKGGEVIELISDLGGGKTTLVRGLARGAGSADHVTSPSFTIRNDYQTKELAIAHFDFYRLNDAGNLRDMLAEAMLDPETAVVIEWATLIDDVLPADHVKIWLKPTADDGREAKVEYPQRFSYLFEGVFDAHLAT
jgi:tRNA threonylcarbamoyladenosine biosynthesis protein TsaE